MRKFGPIHEMSPQQSEELIQTLGFRCDLPRPPFAIIVTLRLRELDREILVFEETVPAKAYTEVWGKRRMIEEAVGRTHLAAVLDGDYVVIEDPDPLEASLSELDEIE